VGGHHEHSPGWRTEPAASDGFRWTQLIVGIICMALIAIFGSAGALRQPDGESAFPETGNI
jgi:hypothetical protein